MKAISTISLILLAFVTSLSAHALDKSCEKRSVVEAYPVLANLEAKQWAILGITAPSGRNLFFIGFRSVGGRATFDVNLGRWSLFGIDYPLIKAQTLTAAQNFYSNWCDTLTTQGLAVADQTKLKDRQSLFLKDLAALPAQKAKKLKGGTYAKARRQKLNDTIRDSSPKERALADLTVIPKAEMGYIEAIGSDGEILGTSFIAGTNFGFISEHSVMQSFFDLLRLLSSRNQLWNMQSLRLVHAHPRVAGRFSDSDRSVGYTFKALTEILGLNPTQVEIAAAEPNYKTINLVIPADFKWLNLDYDISKLALPEGIEVSQKHILNALR